jgi:hypothetical protein
MQGARWLFFRAGDREKAQLRITTSGGAVRSARLTCKGAVDTDCVRIDLSATDDDVNESGHVHLSFEEGNTFEEDYPRAFPPRLDELPNPRIVEGHSDGLAVPLHTLLTEAIRRGRAEAAKGIVRDLLLGAKDVVILTEGNSPIVHIVYDDHSVPVALAGDGVHSLVRLSLELAAREQETVLLEEPEVHQHPAAIRQSVRAIMAAVRRDIQVILTTHSLELIDALVAESSDEDYERMSLYRLELDQGKLISVRIPGAEVARSRGEVEKDLR